MMMMMMNRFENLVLGNLSGKSASQNGKVQVPHTLQFIETRVQRPNGLAAGWVAVPGNVLGK